MTTPVIIEAALNGITSRGRNPHVPITPAELAQDAIACVDAGATVVHTHAHNFGAPVDELVSTYAECYAPVLDARPGTILYPTIGGGATSAERFHHVVELASSGLIRASVLCPGPGRGLPPPPLSLRGGGWPRGGGGPAVLPPPMDYVYTNTFNDTRYGV